jgi:hypothetical protein
VPQVKLDLKVLKGLLGHRGCKVLKEYKGLRGL